MPEEYIFLNGPEGLEKLMQRLRDGEIEPIEAMKIIADVVMPSVAVRDCTIEYKAVLHALGFTALADVLAMVRVRLGDGTVTVGLELKEQINLNDRSDAERQALEDALLAVLRGHDIPASRDEDGGLVFRADNSEQVVASFVADVEQALGPSAPDPRQGRWGRWL